MKNASKHPVKFSETETHLIQFARFIISSRTKYFYVTTDTRR